MEPIIPGLFGLIVGIIIGMIGAVVFQHFSQSRGHTPESDDERIEIEAIDGRRFKGRFHGARLIADGKTVDFDHVRYIDHNSNGMQFHLAEGDVQYPYEQLDGEVTITVSGVSDLVVIPLKEVGYLGRRTLDHNA